MRYVLLCLVFVSSLAMARNPKPKLNPVTVVDRFSVVFPDLTASKHTILTFDNSQTRMDYCTWRTDFDGVEYLTAYSSFPDSGSAAVYAKIKPDVFLKGARDGMKGKDGLVTLDEEISVDEASGRNLTIEAGKNVVRAKLFYKNQTLYQVLVAGPKDKVTGSEATRFLESFKLER
jgi:hypothetical protein